MTLERKNIGVNTKLSKSWWTYEAAH